MSTRFPVIFCLCLPLLAGCGGGGGNGAPHAANLNATIHWAARGRSLDAPASALSAVFTLKKAAPGGGDFHFTVNRDAAPTAYTKSYTSPDQAVVGTWPLAVRFYSQADGGGSVVATVDATVTLGADGNGIGDFVTSGTIASVTVAVGQTVGVGQPVDLTCTATDTGGAAIALAPGAAVFNVTDGADKLQIVSGQQATGLTPGTAMVTATVDGITSAPQTVTVAYRDVVNLTPLTSTVLPNGQLQLSATVKSMPDNSVVWNVQESAGGTVIAGQKPYGNTDPAYKAFYLAPATPGTYHVIARSHYDTSFSATATVTVTAGPASRSGIFTLTYGYAESAYLSRITRMDDMAGANWNAFAGAEVPGGRTSVSGQAMCLDAAGRIYLADTSNKRIVRMDDITGANWTTFGAQGSGVGQFQGPTSVAVDSHGRIYVADNNSGRIVRIDDMTGANWTEYRPAGSVGLLAVGPDDRIYFFDNEVLTRMDAMDGSNLVRGPYVGSPRSLYVAANGRIYWSRYQPNSGMVVRVDDIAGTNLVSFTGVNTQLNLKTAIAVTVGPDSRIYIADGSTDGSTYRIVRIDDMTGTNWTTLGTAGAGTGQFGYIVGLAVR